MNFVKVASLLPRPVLKYAVGGFVIFQKIRGQNYIRCNWRESEWAYKYQDPASLTFFVDAKVDDGATGREEIPLDYFADLAENHDAMLDLGAHMGSVAVVLGALNPGLTLHCFEPVEENLAVLKDNLTANGIDADVHDAVVGTEDGSMIFYEQVGGNTRKLHMFDDTVGHSTSSVYSNDTEYQSTEKEVIDIFQFCRKRSISRPFFKIDIEGSEHTIMDELLHGGHGLEGFSAIVELHPDLIDNGHAHEVVFWLEQQGIEIEWVKTRNPRRMALYCSTLT